MKKRVDFTFARVLGLVCALMVLLALPALAKCVDSDGKEHKKHDWGEWTVTQEPTCKKEGERTRVCNRCGTVKSESIDALGHDWGDWTVTREAGCEEAGVKVRVCSRCGHESEKEIEALGHDYGDWSVVREPSCGEAGVKARTCARCGHESKKEIEALGHDWGDWAVTKEPTCGEAGKQERTCARCGETDKKKLDALGHDWGDWTVTQEPGCEKAGKQERTCARCGETESQKLEALGHSWGDWTVTQEPGCEEAGSEERVCERCGGTESRKIDALGHDWGDWTVTMEPGCEEGGSEERACERCGSTESRKLDALGHNWSEWGVVKDATCEEAGSEERECPRCGSFETRKVDALGHDWGEWTTTRAASCTEDETLTRQCARCGKEETKVGTAALGHDYQATVTEPTCEKAGFTTYICSRCGDSYTEEGAPALDHDWGEWTIVKEPTEKKAGLQKRFCNRCGAEESAKIDPRTDEPAKFRITFVDWDGTVLLAEKEYDEGTKAQDIEVPETPTRASTDEFDYAFDHWDPAITDVAADATYTAVYTETRRTYTVTWIGGDGNPLQTSEVPYGDTPAYSGKEPTMVLEGDPHTYTFAGWEPAIVPVVGEATYTAVFTSDVIITIDLGYDGLTETIAGSAGDTVEEPKPEREGYTFAGWKLPEGVKAFPKKLTEDMTITALWRPNIVAIAGLDPIECHTYKPSLEDALKLMPTTVQVTLGDAEGTKVEAILAWDENACPDFGKNASADEQGDGTYAFTAASVQARDAEGNLYALNEGVELPVCELTVGPATSTDGQYEYRLDADDKLTISKWKGKGKKLIIEAKIDGYDVVAIGKEAFKGKSGLIELTLPLGLTAIGDSAFEGCTGLTNLVVPAGVTTLGSRAFAACTQLASLELPDSLTAVPVDLVAEDLALTRLTLGTSLETTLTATNSYTRAPQKGETPDESTGMMPPVTLPMAVTDIHVYMGKTVLDCDFTVASGCVVTVDALGTLGVREGNTLVNLGTVTNAGAISNRGAIVTCGGKWKENEPKQKGSGSYVTEHDYQLDANFEYNVCKVCGHKEKFTPTKLKITYTGATLSKVYDKTRNVIDASGQWLLSGKLSRSDFKLHVDPNHKDVRISKISIAKFTSADAGNYNLEVTYTLGGADAGYYTVDKGKIPARIDLRPVVIRPKAGLSKVYGTADPARLGLNCTPEGLLLLTEEEKAAGKQLYTGAMRREPGEDVGTYKYLRGNLDFGNKNYSVTMADEVFTITAKSINSTDVGLVTIGNQRYTGKAITPTITMRYGTLTLKQDVDFKAAFSDNVGPGTAKVKLTGMGNYTGERETSFTILKVADGGTDGGGNYTHPGFDPHEFDDPEGDDDDFFGDDEEEDEDNGRDFFGEAEEDDEDEDGSEEGGLVLDDMSYGTVLFDAQGAPMPFVQFEEEDELVPGNRILTIIPDPMIDEETGDDIFLDGGARERYPELHLRLGTSLVQTLADNGVSEIVYELEQADLHIPLASLLPEIPTGATGATGASDAADAAGDTGDDDSGLLPEEAAGDLGVITLDDELDLEGTDAPDLEGDDADETVGEIGALGDEGLAPATVQVEYYDFCIEQIDATGLTDRETEALGDAELLVPGYRVRVSMIPVGAEQVPTGRTDEGGSPITQPTREPLPEGFYLQDVTLMMLPELTLARAPEGAQVVYVSIMEQPEDEDVVERVPAEFTDADGVMAVLVPVNSDGMYAVTEPESWDPAEYMAEETYDEDEDSEEGFEDFGEEEDEGFDEEEEGFDDFGEGEDEEFDEEEEGFDEEEEADEEFEEVI